MALGWPLALQLHREVDQAVELALNDEKQGGSSEGRSRFPPACERTAHFVL